MKSVGFQGELKEILDIMSDGAGCGTCIVCDERKKKPQKKKTAAFFCQRIFSLSMWMIINYKHTTDSYSYPQDNPKRAKNGGH